MDPWHIIQELESNNSSLFKQDVIKQNIDNVNDIIDTFNIATPSDGDLLQYSSSSGQWEQVASSSVGSAANFAIIRTTSSDADNELISSNYYRRGLASVFDPNGIITFDDSAGLTNTFTLGAGNYIFNVFSRSIVFNQNLYNDTDASDLGLLVNPNEIDPGQGYSNGKLYTTIASSKVFSVRVLSAAEGDRNDAFQIDITKF